MNKANALVLKAAKPPSQRAQNPLTPPSALARTLTTGVMTPLPARAPVPTQRHAVQLPLTLRSAESSAQGLKQHHALAELLTAPRHCQLLCHRRVGRRTSPPVCSHSSLALPPVCIVVLLVFVTSFLTSRHPLPTARVPPSRPLSAKAPAGTAFISSAPGRGRHGCRQSVGAL